VAASILGLCRNGPAVLAILYLTTSAAVADASISSQKECLSIAVATWLPSDVAVWQKICKGQNVDLKDLPDTQRKLSAEFLRDIVSDINYTRFLPHRRLAISGASFEEEVEIVNADIDELKLDDCSVRNLKLINAKIRSLLVMGGRLGGLMIKPGSFSEVVLSPALSGDVFLTDVAIEGSLEIGGPRPNPALSEGIPAHISALVVLSAHIRALAINQNTTLDFLMVANSTFEEYLRAVIDNGINRDIKIEFANFSDDKVNGALDLRESDIVRLSVRNTEANQAALPPNVPRLITLKSFEFTSWSNDLPTTIGYLTANSIYDPPLFDRIAQSFRRDGNYMAVRKIGYMKANQDYQHSAGITKPLMLMSWASVGYGYYPEVGFIWIGLLVIFGFFVFRTGKVTAGEVPRSWLVYAVDTVVPVIKLDAKHGYIQFSGWRQYFVYIMRMLSAGLAYLVFRFLQNAVTGG